MRKRLTIYLGAFLVSISFFALAQRPVDSSSGEPTRVVPEQKKADAPSKSAEALDKKVICKAGILIVDTKAAVKRSV